MKKLIVCISVAVLLIPVLADKGFAADVDIGDIFTEFTGPPAVKFAQEPEVVAIPGRYAYFIPDIDADIFFYRGNWYRLYRNRWFLSDSYKGPWDRVREVPSALKDLPSDYRSVPRGYNRVPYGDLSSNWERWEREKYWDRRRDEDRERSVAITPPAVRIMESPDVLPIPGRYVYFIPDIDADIFFYHDSWYRFYKGRWFASDGYNGPWDYIRRVPSAIKDVPLDYRTVPSRFQRIPYGEVRNKWDRWEQEKHWELRREETDVYRNEGDRY